jgi:hypothetical protein
MLAGEGIIGIWNGIAPEARAQFYDWHINEHMPERVGIPGFCRGRRFIAVDAATHPAFFTLYEADTPEVLKGQDYANRLNNPTPWTQATTVQFRDTFRSLARAVHSAGPGMGMAMLTLRFDVDDPAELLGLLRAAQAAPRVCGTHLCVGDLAASGVRTAETAGRTDIQAPPAWFAMVEATDAAALAGVLPEVLLAEAGVRGVVRGVYALEYVRGKTGWT